MTMTLDEIRAEIVTRCAVLGRALDRASAELIAHDRAAALFVPAATAAPRAARRNGSDLVAAALTAKPQTVAELAAATKIAPSRVLGVLAKLRGEGGVGLSPGGGYVRKDDGHA